MSFLLDTVFVSYSPNFAIIYKLKFVNLNTKSIFILLITFQCMFINIVNYCHFTLTV